MTYQQIKEKVVDENNLMDNKQFKAFIIKYSLGMLGLILDFCIATSVLVGVAVSTILGIICVYAYGAVLDYIVEDLSKVSTARKIVNFWWLSYILIIGTVFILKYFRFM